MKEGDQEELSGSKEELQADAKTVSRFTHRW